MHACALYRTGQAMHYNVTLRQVHVTTFAVEKQ